MLYKAKNILEISKGQKTLLYNPFWNKACIVDKDWYANSIKEKDDKLLELSLSDLNKGELETLLKNGILYLCEDTYNQNSYKEKIKRRNTDLEINTVYFHMTQRCNLKCSYCYNKKNLNKKDRLSTDQIDKIITKLKKIGTKRIIITGGEPLLRNDILKIIKIIKNNDFVCELLTNGVLISENKEVLDLVDIAIISLDTFNESSNERKGLNLIKFKDDLLTIDPSLRHKITLRSVISKTTQSEWPTIKEFALKNGFNFGSSIFLPNNKKEIENQPNINNIELDLSVVNFSGNFCGASYKEIAIDSDGTVYPCQSLIDSSFSITNILNDNWYEELNNSKITDTFRKLSVDNIEKCKDCNIRYLCGGGCRAIPYKVYGGLEKYSECICDYQKEIVRLKLFKILDNLEASEKNDRKIC